MKLNLRTLQIRPTAGLRGAIEKQLASLQDLVPITAAHVLLGKYRDRNPPFCAAVHLEVPGPDIHAADSDHTIVAAFRQVERTLREQITLRFSRRLQNQKNRRRMRPVPQPRR